MKKLFLSLILLMGLGFLLNVPAHATVTSTSNQIIYSGDGLTSTWSFPFKVYNSASENDLMVQELVVATGVITTLTLNNMSTGYTVTLSGPIPSAGTITLAAGALPVGTNLSILRQLPLTQSVAESDNSATSASVRNNLYDRLVMIDQQEQQQISLSITQSSFATNQLIFPLGGSSYGGYAIGWDPTGTFLENIYFGGSGSSLTLPVSIANGGTNANTASNALTSLAGGHAVNTAGGLVQPTGAINAANGALILNSSGQIAASQTNSGVAVMYPGLYQRNTTDQWVLATPYSTAANRYTILTPNNLSLTINGTIYFLTSQQSINLSTAGNWDNTSPNYTVAANRAGLDFYIYACVPGSGTAPVILLSANATAPSGYTTTNSRQIGGFHGLCVAVGTISGHTLTGFLAGDVLPASIWDLNFRPKFAKPQGMVYCAGINRWVDIYLASGTGTSTASVYNATFTATRTWNDFVDDGGAVYKKLLDDEQFQVMATGTNEGTNILGSANPGTTGGHVDTASRRMISNIGVEDATGVADQWLSDQSYQYVGTSWGWVSSATGTGKGQLYIQGANADVKLIAGGSWVGGTNAGSRSRTAANYRWNTNTGLGGRFCAEPL